MKKSQGFPINKNGFTLVELMVASVIVIISIAAVVTMIRKGQEITSDGGHRYTARSKITSVLESSQFDYSNYTYLSPQTIVDTVVIDTRGTTVTTDDLKGIRTVVVGAQDSILGTGSIWVPFIPLTFQVVWVEPEGPDTEKIEKKITQAE
jgi:type II secretory pathway pseudopilin PulG